MSLEQSVTAPNETTATPFKYPSPIDAHRAAKRRIVNNALRRQQASLDLSNFGLMELPKEIGRLTSLRRLNISNNRISQLPHEIGDLTQLRMLNVRSNKLISIPDAIGALHNLKILSVERNKLRELPDSIGRLVKLEQLLLDNNDLESLPSEIGALVELTDLGLDYNKLSSLPQQFSGLLKLTNLYLNANKFSELPSVILELRKLKVLLIGNNDISAIPAAIAKLANLEALFLLGNSIDSVPPAIAALKLRSLDLTRNHLRKLPNELGTVSSLAVGAKRTPKYDGLRLGKNDLPEPYPALIAPGQPKATENVLAWLRGELNLANLKTEQRATPAAVPPAPPEPSEEAGPTFHVVAGQVDLIAGRERTTDFDREIQQTLHQRLRRRVQLLHEATTKVSNQHPQLLTVVDEYIKLVRPEFIELDVVDLWASGNALMAQAHSFQHQDRTRTLSEPLEPSHLGLLTEVAALHGGFILGFPTAVRLSDRADQARIGPETLRAITPSTSNVLSALSRQRRLLSERARQLIESLDAALLPGSWEIARIGYTSYATVRNALVAIGRVCIWINDKGGSLVGGALVGSAMVVTNLPPDTIQLVMLFLKTNSADILSFAAPFPELRAYLEWIIDYFDDQSMRPKHSMKKA